MAAFLNIHENKKITADSPSDNAEWVDVSQFSFLNLHYKVSTPSGTNARLETYIQWSNNNTVTGTNGIKDPLTVADFFNAADEVRIANIPVMDRYARIYRDVSGTSPVYYLSVVAIAHD